VIAAVTLAEAVTTPLAYRAWARSTLTLATAVAPDPSGFVIALPVEAVQTPETDAPSGLLSVALTDAVAVAVAADAATNATVMLPVAVALAVAKSASGLKTAVEVLLVAVAERLPANGAVLASAALPTVLIAATPAMSGALLVVLPVAVAIPPTDAASPLVTESGTVTPASAAPVPPSGTDRTTEVLVAVARPKPVAPRFAARVSPAVVLATAVAVDAMRYATLVVALEVASAATDAPSGLLTASPADADATPMALLASRAVFDRDAEAPATPETEAASA
jgi:hypothetical protein